ncbi:hypothetical protein [Planctomycetes bacterium TBK1r]|uniref:DUF559 domain-containing protein n=1 Tax=Stieleria magnilauensis TaxID=2527963 RepID=A0ABX5XY00_9BACT|nr:hypothetical protein TBK1r_59360 [Planctomycetes bacterium TBK1r]QDV86987.1 hypothetical protein TBK1r_60140 [Planctomycetes bacterium TBK1r]
MPAKLTTEEFIRRARVVHGDFFDYSEVEYTGAMDHVTIICPVHGRYKQSPNNHYRQQGCPACEKKGRQLQRGDFFRKARAKYGDDYDYPVQEFFGAKTPVKVVCKKHGEFTATAGEHVSWRGCPECLRIKRVVLSDHVAVARECKTPVLGLSAAPHVKDLLFLCKSCFSRIDPRYRSGLCGQCRAGWNITPFSQVVAQARRIHGDTFTYDEETYVSTVKPMAIKCSAHGTFRQTPQDHLKGQGCPVCKSPKGERRIANWLAKHGVAFKHQHRIRADGRTVVVDFFVPEENAFIEFDGQQHRKPVKRFGGKEAFFRQVERDQWLDRYAEIQGIYLVRLQSLGEIEPTLENSF